MGKIDQETFGLVFRLDYAITPDLTIQYYGQPFMSAGNYMEFKKIIDSKADNYYDRFHVFNDNEISYYEEDNIYLIDENGDGSTDYEFDNPNFNFLQYRSNLVFRWEYVPGSVLYLVWSQDMTDDEADDEEYGDFKFGEGFNKMFATTPSNVFLVKVSYRIKLR